ncbi:CPBP family intramembrane glutamic endopeptidase [Euryhalocaulis caribicus]|uniref:CPBP family intramembrane glutamic endopeptidase n=1 Tax=Euryhalocaulis caribicus TaxID=1161401 RepID=UPI0003A43336|nr:CPBP family intramembrane glutamic endopeptidase [Euryhalocaulis caribicus]
MTIFRNGVWLFLLIAFAFSGAIGGVIHATGAMERQLLFTGLAFIYMCGPAIAALVCAARFDRGRMRQSLGVAKPFNRALVWAWLIPVSLILGALAIDLVFSPAMFDPGANYRALLESQGQDLTGSPVDPVSLYWFGVASGLTLGAFLNMFLTLSEELGWRGWLWDHWRGLGFWRCNLLIGLFWGLWHAPLIAQGYNYPELPVWGPVAMTALMLVISPLIGWVREAGGTVFHAGLFHGTLNAGAGLGVLALTGLEFPFKGTLGVGGFVTGLALCGIVFAIRKRAANAPPETGQAL